MSTCSGSGWIPGWLSFPFWLRWSPPCWPCMSAPVRNGLLPARGWRGPHPAAAASPVVACPAQWCGAGHGRGIHALLGHVCLGCCVFDALRPQGSAAGAGPGAGHGAFFRGAVPPHAECGCAALQQLQQLLPEAMVAALQAAIDMFGFDQALQCAQALASSVSTSSDSERKPPHAAQA